MLNRRTVLKNSALVSLAPLMPTFLCKLATATESQPTNGNILVVIQMDGGNDGINAVVPYKDEGYAQHRKQLRIPQNELITLSDTVALNPRLRSASELFQSDRLSIVHGVGYPNPNRSHFESMAFWHAGSNSADQVSTGNGWLGQSLSSKPETNDPHAIQVGDETLPVALRGRRCNATTLSSFADLQLRIKDTLASQSLGNDSVDPLSDFVTKSVSNAYVSAQQISAMTKSDSSVRYPDSKLGNRLQMISQMIKSGSTTQVYYTIQSGYDTHATQLDTHGNLLGEYSSSLKAFVDDLKQSGLEDRVVVMAFSEFGRRVTENDSFGTDHGTAGPVFLSGTHLANRFYGTLPSLTDLDGDDLKYNVDFRSLYASLVTDWLNLQLPDTLQSFHENNPLKLFG